jgi:hypothetical protein
MTDNPPESTDDSPSGGESEHPSEYPSYRPPDQEEFDWRGWLLVGVIVVSFLVVPAAVLYLPYAQDFIAEIGIGWRQAYLTLPMIPALLLGGVSIWAAVSSRREK